VGIKKPRKQKTCLRCGEEIAETRRSHALYCTDLCGTLYRNKFWQAKNPEKMKAAIKLWGQQNPDRIRALQDRQLKRLKDKRTKKFEKSPVRECSECGEKILARTRRIKSQWCSYLCQTRGSAKNWARKYPGKATARGRRYLTQKSNACPGWLTKDQSREMDKIYETARQLGLHVDHIVPLQGKNVCGLHVPWNLQMIPPDVNIAKGNKHVS